MSVFVGGPVRRVRGSSYPAGRADLTQRAQRFAVALFLIRICRKSKITNARSFHRSSRHTLDCQLYRAMAISAHPCTLPWRAESGGTRVSRHLSRRSRAHSTTLNPLLHSSSPQHRRRHSTCTHLREVALNSIESIIISHALLPHVRMARRRPHPPPSPGASRTPATRLSLVPAPSPNTRPRTRARRRPSPQHQATPTGDVAACDVARGHRRDSRARRRRRAHDGWVGQHR